MKKAALFVVVLIVAGWAIWQAGKPDEGMQAMSAWSQPALSKAAAIRIDGPGIAVQLRRGDGGGDAGKWSVTAGATTGAADEDAVQHLLDDLAAMRPERVVAHDATHDADLHLDAAHAIRVQVVDASGQPLLALSVGGQGTDLVSTYVRRAGQKEVVAVNRALLWQLKRAPAGWLAVKKNPATDKAGKAS